MDGAAINVDREPTGATWRQIVFGRNPNRTLRRVLVWSFLATVFFHNLLLPIQIIGSSMSPTYRDRSYNFINKVAYNQATPVRGDVVACHADGDLLLKRIVALPGETVEIEDGELKVNKRPLRDQFAGIKIPWEMNAIHLKEGEYFVIGDNRASSVFCKIQKSDIVGKIMF